MRFVRPVGIFALAALAAYATPALGQSSNTCGGVATPLLDACQKGADILTFMTPQLGNGLAGGNTTPGQGGSLGGFPHFAVSVRATGSLDANLPDFGNVGFRATGTTSPATADNVAMKKQAFGLGAVDAALGIFSGINLGVGSVGGVDALVSASYVPDVSSGAFAIKPETPISLGFGARVGLFDGTAVLPSVGISYLQRSLPKTTLTAQSTGVGGGQIELRDFDLKTSSWRLTARQTLLVIGLTAGYGQDTYDASTTFKADVTGIGTTGGQTARAKVTRTNWFVGADMSFILFKLFAEYGQVSGGDLATINRFGGSFTSVNDNKSYLSAGLRLGF